MATREFPPGRSGQIRRRDEAVVVNSPHPGGFAVAKPPEFEQP